MTVCEIEKLRDCFISILEDTAFMFAQTEDEEVNGDNLSQGTAEGNDGQEETLQAVEIFFTGPVCGCIVIACHKDFMTTLAANVLGIDEEKLEKDSDRIDALKEFLNILCGNFLTSLTGTGEVFDLSIPKVSENNSQNDIKKEMDVINLFDVEDYKVSLALSINLS